MQKEEKYKLINSLLVPGLFVLVMWAIKIIEVLLDVRLNEYGIKPLSLLGLRGIVCSPFLHADWNHLFANTVPILILGGSLYYFYRQIANKVLIFSILMTGLWTWAGARSGVHIGASGVIYSLATFLMLSGFLRRDSKLSAISFIVIFLYGSLVWGVFPDFFPRKNISWEGHLSGFISGVILAFFYRKDGPQREVHSWDDEDDDEDDDENQSGEKPYWDIPQPDKKDLTVVYRFRRR